MNSFIVISISLLLVFSGSSRANVVSSQPSSTDSPELQATEKVANPPEPASDVSVGYMKDMDLMDVSTMENTTKATSKFLEMYDEQSSMEDHYSMATMEMTIDVSDNSMLEVVDSQAVESMNRTEMMVQEIPAAICAPYDMVIRVPNSKSNVILYPSWILVKRCGGSCGVGQACYPDTTQDIYVKVYKWVFDGGMMIPQEMVDKVKVEEHLSCKCGCEVQPEHCNPATQYHDDYNCECKCNNQDQADSCPSNMIWNSDLCGCVCIDQKSCNSQHAFFNPQTCSCEFLRNV